MVRRSGNRFRGRNQDCPKATPAPRLDDDASTRGPRCLQLQP
jgi:hypothetical protein